MFRLTLLATLLAGTSALAASDPCYKCEYPNPATAPIGGIRGDDGKLDGDKLPAPVGDDVRVIVTSGGGSTI